MSFDHGLVRLPSRSSMLVGSSVHWEEGVYRMYSLVLEPYCGAPQFMVLKQMNFT